MANALYPKWKEAMLQGSSDSTLNGTVKAALVDLADYTYSASHEFYSSIASAVVGTPITLGSKTYTNGVFDAADGAFSSVTGDESEAVIIFIENGGANTTWRLVAYYDTGITGAPVTPNGGNINLGFNASGLFAI